MIILILIVILLLAYVVLGAKSQHKHHKMMKNVQHRIHVNGIRGKSTVTRLIAGALREGGIETIGKTTGTASRMIINHRKDIPVSRKEADIAEQRRMLKHYLESSSKNGNKYDAVVFECMAINPLYQKYLENKIMHSTIGVITNVREDHMDMLGTSLSEIAMSLSSTIPQNGHLVTAETNEEILEIFKKECMKKNTILHSVGNMPIADKHMAKFRHFEYKSNVAIAIKVGQLVGIDRTTALIGAQKALPDPGAFKLKKVNRKNTTLHWANLFAINDRESFVLTVQSLHEKVGSKTQKAVILNNRHDRPERVSQFVNICAREINADIIFTFGDYETQVVQELKKYPESNIKVVKLGNSTEYRAAGGATLLNEIVSALNGKESILFGAVNIHTPQANSLLQRIERKRISHAH